ncbi:LacI family DNA-binding transcriptional regulator [Nonomuraea lactucae]|uniref:LacI family DNA-binding transcriptional regulator n=1 Tax=Nonomuraea lactucae TaxID=2249762 RepID=UPI000DE4DC91|nr:LacI family DNA-binding transcriptional regulator [Nonomuraea lactucae]
MAATSKDVARLAGVSQPTVSRALRGHPSVAPETRRRVEEAARALDYVASERGRVLSLRKTHRIGIVVSDLTNPFYPHLLAPLHDYFKQAGFRTVLFTEQDEDGPTIEELADGSLDGIVLTTSLVDSPLPAALMHRDIPFVFLNRESDATADSAVVDNVYGAALVGDLLVELGHHRIGAVFGPRAASTGRDRETGFRRSLSKHGRSLADELAVSVPFSFSHGRAALGTLLARSEPPTALFCGNDVIALGVLDGAVELGVRIPEDLTVVGFDDITIASWAHIGLTTVHCDLDRLARTAGDLLLKRIADPDREHVRSIQRPHLVLRRSHARLQLPSSPSKKEH